MLGGVTITASGLLIWETAGVLAQLGANSLARIAEQIAFIAVAGVLLYGNLVYQVTRLGYIDRRLRHRGAESERLERAHDEVRPPAIAILVPAYREEARVVRKALLSAALQDYPLRRVVLLIDDPPHPSDAKAAAALEAARRLPGEIAELLRKSAEQFASELEDFLVRSRSGALDERREVLSLAESYAQAAAWFDARASECDVVDHTDRLFVEEVLKRPAIQLRDRRNRLISRLDHGEAPPLDEVLREYRRLTSLFRVELTSFERKRYANLSHEPNKAMNLNSYLALLGRSFDEVERHDGLHLESADPRSAQHPFPDAEFVLTLDADSVLASGYLLQLVALLREPGNERVAVAQTPYSAFPRAEGMLERIAGATTDVQYRIHQGFTRHGATFWVGANALLRMRALRELRSVRRERGHEVAVFIQDRTVIEDTESSVDLITRGWTLYNHPERLAWSATPPDFGALVIQRRRWANGGLLILPALLRYLMHGPRRAGRLTEGWLRCHYLTSIAGVNVALLVLLLFPFEHALRSLWFPIAAIPYFFLYGRDLLQLGYPMGDLVRVYALNLLLLPVNLAGVVRSIQQAVSGVKAPFGRTPKVTARTPAPALHHLSHWAILALLVAVLTRDLERGLWIHASFVACNGLLLLWGALQMVGVRAALQDIRAARGARWGSASSSHPSPR